MLRPMFPADGAAIGHQAPAVQPAVYSSGEQEPLLEHILESESESRFVLTSDLQYSLLILS